MYQCTSCKAIFEEPDSREVCCEAYAGVYSHFANHNWKTIAVCPDCGSDEIDEFYCDGICEECSIYYDCTSDERKEEIDSDR